MILNQFRTLTESCPVSDEELINLTKETLQENAFSITQYLIIQKTALILAATLEHKAIVASPGIVGPREAICSE